jgi:hypothetical protein
MITKSPSPRSWQKSFAPKILATYLAKLLPPDALIPGKRISENGILLSRKRTLFLVNLPSFAMNAMSYRNDWVGTQFG